MKEIGNFKDRIMLGECKVDGRSMPAAKMLDASEPFEFDAAYVSALCITVFNCFEVAVKHDKKEKFEKDFKLVFDEMFRTRKQYSIEKPANGT
jgi:hypothetical protein